METYDKEKSVQDDKLRPNSPEKPLISIIMAVYNGAKYLIKALESVRDQDYGHVELIVIDGNSTDNSVAIIKEFAADIAYFVTEPDRGIYDAWNKGVAAATGEWLCFIGADDFFYDDKALSKILPYLNQAKAQQARYVYGKVVQLTENAERVIDTLGPQWEQASAQFRKSMPVAHCGSFHHRDLFRDHGLFDATFRIAGDYEFLLREFKNAKHHAIFAEEVTVVGMRSGGISGNLDHRLIMAQETDTARKKNGITEVSYEIVFWIFRIRAFMALDKVLGRNLTSKFADMYRLLLKGKGKRWSE